MNPLPTNPPTTIAPKKVFPRTYSDNPELRALSGNDRFSFPETFVRLLKSAQKTPDFVYLISAQDEKAIYSLSILIKVAASRVALTFD